MASHRRFEIKILRLLRHLRITEDRAFLVLTIVVGLLCGLTAVIFHELINWITQRTVARAVTEGWGLVALVPAAGGLAAGVFLRFLPGARGSGIPQVKEAFFLRYGNIPGRETIGKLFLGATCIGTGFSLGREGPTVHICSGVASYFGRLLSLSQQKVRMLIPVGAAAGLAAAFNTPIAAVTFTLEEIVGDINASILGSTVVAAVTASVVEHLILGDAPVFGVQEFRLQGPWEILLFVPLGLLGGLVSVAFTRSLLGLRETLGEYRRLEMIMPGIGGLVVGAVGLLLPQVLGIGYPSVMESLAGQLLVGTLLLLLAAKFAATVVSYAAGASGGIFAPTLFMGAMLGGAIGLTNEFLFPSLVPQPAAFALVGMGVLFAGIIRAPMTSVLIIFEMTRDYHIILPLMVGNLVSFYVSQRLQPTSIYDALAMQDGVHLPRPHQHQHRLRSLLVQDIMIRNPFCLESDVTVEQAWERVNPLPYKGFPVKTRSGDFLGMLSLRELKLELASDGTSRSLGEVTATPCPHTHPDETLELALEKLGQSGVSRLPVVSRTNAQQLLGLITVSDVMRALGVARD